MEKHHKNFHLQTKQLKRKGHLPETAKIDGNSNVEEQNVDDYDYIEFEKDDNIESIKEEEDDNIDEDDIDNM